MGVDVIVEEQGWRPLALADLSKQAVGVTLQSLGLDPGAFEVAVLGCGDARIADLNRDFRGKPQPTNVLSWPSDDRGPTTAGGKVRAPQDSELGDIAIALETCQREAREFGKPVSAHVTHLLVHGTLHLLGYDHIDPQDAAIMERLEVEILAKMGLPDPY